MNPARFERQAAAKRLAVAALARPPLSQGAMLTSSLAVDSALAGEWRVTSVVCFLEVLVRTAVVVLGVSRCVLVGVLGPLPFACAGGGDGGSTGGSTTGGDNTMSSSSVTGTTSGATSQVQGGSGSSGEVGTSSSATSTAVSGAGSTMGQMGDGQSIRRIGTFPADLPAYFAVGPSGEIVTAHAQAVVSMNAMGTENWTFPLTTAFNSEVLSVFRPAIGSDGTVLVALNTSVSGYVLALRNNGTEAWRFGLGSHSTSSGTLFEREATALALGADGTVYVGDPDDVGTNHPGHRVHAIGPDGMERWSTIVGTNPAQNGDLAGTTAPTIGPDGRVYVMKKNFTLYGMNAQTGAMEVEQPLADTLVSPAGAPLVTVGNVVILRVFDLSDMASTLAKAEVRAYNIVTGARLWTTTGLANQDIGEPVLGPDGSAVMFPWGNYSDGTGAGIVSLRLSDGSEVFKYSDGYGDLLEVLLGADGNTYALMQNDAAGAGPVIMSFTPTGAIRWQNNLRCRSGEGANETWTSLSILPSGELLVLCGMSSATGSVGGVHVVRSSTTLASSPWAMGGAVPANTHRDPRASGGSGGTSSSVMGTVSSTMGTVSSTMGTTSSSMMAGNSSSAGGGWLCDPSWYDDAENICDCGCGIADADCTGASCTTPGCSTAGCDSCVDQSYQPIFCE